MPRAQWLADTLHNTNLTIHETPGWENRGSTDFAPTGILIHHTAAPRGKPAPSLTVVTHGRTGLPGPLCHILIGRDNTCHLIAAGRANHAGTGGPLGHIPRNLGNRHLIGIEAENDGVGEPWDPGQLHTLVTVTAALLHHLNRPAAHVWGHKEWAPGRKIDPAGIDMTRFRAAVADALTQGAPVPHSQAQEDAQRILNSWLPEVKRILPDGDWGPRSTDALRYLFDEILAPELDGHAKQVHDLQAEVDSYRTEVAALRAEVDAARAGAGLDPHTVALATIGAKTREWVETVTAELARIDGH